MKGRSIEFDLIKGFAIFLVVMGHIIFFGMPESSNSLLFRIIGSVHMPLFFFVSGWFLYKTDEQGYIKPPVISSRFTRLVIPGAVMLLLWCQYYPQGPFDGTSHEFLLESLLSPSKGGYWFPLVLFEANVVLWIALRLFSIGKSLSRDIIVLGAAWLSLSALILIIPTGITNVFSLISVRLHFPALAMGLLARCHRDAFNRMLQSEVCISVSIVFIIGFNIFTTFLPEIAHKLIIYTIVYQVYILCLFIIAMTLCQRLKSINNIETSAISRFFGYLGKRSFAIYLIHYFFLFPFPVGEAIIATSSFAFMPMFITSIAGALAVIGVTLTVDYILRFSPILGWLCCGDPTPRKMRAAL